MKYIQIFILAFLYGGCTATLVSSPEKDLHIIGHKTGKFGHNWYDSNFIKTAKKACHGKDFKILEKSTSPKALKNAGILIKKYHYYWVIQCEKDQNTRKN